MAYGDPEAGIGGIGAFEGEGGYTGPSSPSGTVGGQAGQGAGYSATGMDDADYGLDINPENIGNLETGGIGGIPGAFGGKASQGSDDKGFGWSFNLFDVLFGIFNLINPLSWGARAAISLASTAAHTAVPGLTPEVANIGYDPKGGFTANLGKSFAPTSDDESDDGEEGEDGAEEDGKETQETAMLGFQPAPELVGGPGQGDRQTGGLVRRERGGMMNLQKQAQNLASKGRGGDTMLVHMRPDEVAGLMALGTISRNPSTGLPEHWLGATLGGLGALALAPMTGGTSLGFLAASPFVAQGLGAGLGQFAEGMIMGQKPRDALERGVYTGIGAGLGSFGLSKLGSMAAGAGSDSMLSSLSDVGKYTPEGLMQSVSPEGGAALAKSMPFGMEGVTQNVDKLMGPMGLGVAGSSALASMATEPPPQLATGKLKSTGPSRPLKKRKRRGEAIDVAGIDFSQYGMGPERRFFRPTLAATGGLMEAAEFVEEKNGVEEEVTAQAVAALRGDHPEPQEAITAYIEMFGEEMFGRLRDTVIEEMKIEEISGRDEVRGEGMIEGAGAGRDDLIRGSIDGQEDLRVSDGEFIVAADVVSGLGDGSSNAGAKRLEAMMDRVRNTRTGTKKQPSRINEEALMPA